MMSRKSVLIIDDEEHARSLIRLYLKEHTDFFLAGESQNGIEAVKYINMLQPDLIFLDIQMPGANGFEVLQRIEHVPKIIFTTAHDTFAIQAFELNAVDYLLKPYTRERFNNSLERMEQSYPAFPTLAANIPANGAYPERMMVETGKRFRNIDVADIIYLKAERDYTGIYTASGTFLSSFGISNIAKRFDPNRFIRVHRSFIVNIFHVKELYRDISKTFLVMDNGEEINVGRNYLSEVKKLII
jgi:two-component system LytT family response regulator